MRVLITGAGGFVGRHLVPELRAADHAVLPLWHSGPSPQPDLTDGRVCDVTDRPALAQVVAETRPDACVHLAGLAFVPDGTGSPERMLAVNAGGTLNLLDAFREHAPAARVLVATSSQVYGPGSGTVPLNEDAPLRPANTYAVSKAAADVAALGYAAAAGMTVMTARPTNHCGPGQSPCFVVPGFACQIRDLARSASRDALRTGNLESERDFMDVRDVVRAYRLILEKGHPGQAYNVSAGQHLRVAAILEALCSLADVEPEIVVDPGKYRPTDRAPVLDTARLRRHTGWSPAIKLDETLRDVWRNVKKKILGILQFAFGLGIIALLLWSMRDNKDELLAALRAGARNWGCLLAGFGCFFVCIALCALRWQKLLAAQQLDVPIGRVLTLFFIGQFFNSFLPGSVSGDIVKAYFVTKQAPHKKTEAVSTVFIDRLVGLLAIIVLTVVTMLVRWSFFMSHPQTRWAIAFNAVLLVGAVGGVLLAFRQNVFERFALFRRIEQRTNLGGMLARVYNAFRLCLAQPTLLFKTMALSLGNHLSMIVAVFFLGTGLDIDLRFVDYLTLFPLINAVAAIPVTPGGLGTRESATIFLLGVLAVPETSAFSLSVLIYAMLLGWSLVGGLVYLAFAHRLGGARSDGAWNAAEGETSDGQTPDGTPPQ